MIKILKIKNKDKIFDTSKVILKILKKEKVCVLRGLIKKKEIQKILSHFKKKFNFSKDIRYSGELTLQKKDFQRLDIGNTYKNTRFMRVMYANERSNHNSKLFHIINPVINLRNSISRIKKIDYTYPFIKGISKTIDKKYYSFCDFVRLIQYPTGGGFLAQHNDYDKYYAKGVYQIIMPLTNIKKTPYTNLGNFEKGGIYFILKNKKKFIENFFKLGDVLIFDPKANHGVDSIDSDKGLNLKNLCGRITLALSITHFKNKS